MSFNKLSFTTSVDDDLQLTTAPPLLTQDRPIHHQVPLSQYAVNSATTVDPAVNAALLELAKYFSNMEDQTRIQSMIPPLILPPLLELGMLLRTPPPPPVPAEGHVTSPVAASTGRPVPPLQQAPVEQQEPPLDLIVLPQATLHETGAPAFFGWHWQLSSGNIFKPYSMIGPMLLEPGLYRPGSGKLLLVYRRHIGYMNKCILKASVKCFL